MKVAVLGSPAFRNYREFIKAVDVLPVSEIISGGVEGVDQFASRYARDKSIHNLIFLSDYRQHGEDAPLLRNQRIVDAAEYIIAFWDGKSREIKEAICHAWSRKKFVRVVNIAPDEVAE